MTKNKKQNVIQRDRQCAMSLPKHLNHSISNRKWFPKSTKIILYFFSLSPSLLFQITIIIWISVLMICFLSSPSLSLFLVLFHRFLNHFQGTFTLIVEAWHDSNATTTRSPGKFPYIFCHSILYFELQDSTDTVIMSTKICVLLFFFFLDVGCGLRCRHSLFRKSNAHHLQE